MKSAQEQDIFRFVGLLPGPSILILGGVHGNERTGIAVVQGLIDDLQSGELTIESGVLTLGLGNQPAIKEGVRAIDGRDLNRYFSTEKLTIDDGSYEFKRANIIAKYILECDILIDLHATNKPSVPFVIALDNDAHKEIYRWFSPENVLIDPNYIFGDGWPVATDEYANQHGKIGICFETGWVEDDSTAPLVIESAKNYLKSLGMINGKIIDSPIKEAKMYEIIQSISCSVGEFVFAENRGMRSFELIKAGDEIGKSGSSVICSQFDGVILFPKLAEHQQINKPVCYIAKLV